MRLLLMIPMLLLMAACTNAQKEDTGLTPQVKDQIRKANSDLTIDDIRETEIPGLYEMKMGNNIYYIDRTGKYLLSGHLFDTSSKQDLTAARLEDINRIDWKLLPLDKAIVSGDPDGMAVAVFTDPDCPYCRQLEKNIKGIKGVKVYTFLFPLTQLHPDSSRKAEAIWCSKNQHEAMTSVMVEDKEIKGGGCKTPIADIAQLAARLGIQGTPTLISADGRKRSGALPADTLKDWLAQKK